MVESHRARRIALTGGIATGKSHVRSRLATLGASTIDADQLARDAVAPGTSGLKTLVQRFGSGVLSPDGTVDRRNLARIIFADARARRDLEDIVHPAVRTAIDDWFLSLDAAGATLGIADIPLLYETGRDRDFEYVIVAACAPATQLRRLMSRDGLSETEARQRIAAQLPIEEKARRADCVIATDASFEAVNRAVDSLWRELANS